MSLVLKTNKRLHGRASGLLGISGTGNDYSVKLPNIIPKNIHSNDLADINSDKYENINLLKQAQTQAI